MLNYNDFPVGITNFAEIIEKKCILIDKTMMIKDVMDDKCKAMLITRPRRFGKTLNMSMLGEFFSRTGKDVFGGLNISRETDFCKQHQNQYPVISITLKDCKGSKFEDMFVYLKGAFAACYSQHTYLLESLNGHKKEFFEEVLSKKIQTPALLSEALKSLSDDLYVHTGRRAIILIDEYDSPIHSAYSHGFYDEIVDFMRVMLGSALKDNASLEKAIITGIARVAKESMFSGLNHLKCYTLMDKRYAQYFGFTQSEVESLLPPPLSSTPPLVIQSEAKDLPLETANATSEKEIPRGLAPLDDKLPLAPHSAPLVIQSEAKDLPLETANDTPQSEVLRGAAPLDDKEGDDKEGVVEEIKRWYNGYRIGDYKIYNPWSIMHCLQNEMKMDVYWLNTSDNALVYDLIGSSDLRFKTQVENLIKGIPQEQVIEDNLTFREMEGNDRAIWTLLFHAGYLNIISQTMTLQLENISTIEIPNLEIMSLYMNIVRRWFYLDNKDHYYHDFLKSLEGDNPDKFLKLVRTYIESSLSYFDMNKKTPEYVFHIFMMGLLVGFRGRYEVDSNGEAGDGRYDVMMIPKDPKDKAIVMEFKVAASEDELEDTAKTVLEQIKDKGYTQGFQGNTLCIGMAFYGKKMAGVYEMTNHFYPPER